MHGGLVVKRRVDDELVITLKGQVVAVVRVIEAARGAAAFDLHLPSLGIVLGIGIKTAGNNVAVQILGPEILHILRRELIGNESRDYAI
jgi:hypothetical protein